MVSVDISAEIAIAAAPADVAAILFDPVREPEWMSTVKSVEVIDPALQKGARVKRSASLMGRPVVWTTEVEAVHFPHVLNLRILDGPFTGTIAYSVQRTESGSHVKIRNRGEANLPAFVPSSLVADGLRAALEYDLGRLKTLVEKA